MGFPLTAHNIKPDTQWVFINVVNRACDVGTARLGLASERGS